MQHGMFGDAERHHLQVLPVDSPELTDGFSGEIGQTDIGVLWLVWVVRRQLLIIYLPNKLKKNLLQIIIQIVIIGHLSTVSCYVILT